MTTAETILIAVTLLLIKAGGERRNPPVGKFVQCDGVSSSAAIRPLLVWCCSMVMDP